jgi:KaiC/GvpD/RAD55 family RecA-like ATPase/predicted hydrocarbon binding protein
MTLAELRNVPQNNLLLITGQPGAGKSALCHLMTLTSVASQRPVLYVTTEGSPRDVETKLKEKGLGDIAPEALTYIDAFSETVGLKPEKKPGILKANCIDLNSLSMAVTKAAQRMGRGNVLLIFDSLTSPYYFSGSEVIRFVRIFLSKFSAQDNAVVAMIDEGCSEPEDLVALESAADGILQLQMQNGSRFVNVIKHPTVSYGNYELPVEFEPTMRGLFEEDPHKVRPYIDAQVKGIPDYLRPGVGDFMPPLWPNLAHWSGVLWDPHRFPRMIYDLNKEEGQRIRDTINLLPNPQQLFFKSLFKLQSIGVLLPKSFSGVKAVKRSTRFGLFYIFGANMEYSGIIEYQPEISKTDEHYFKILENSDCWGLNDVGTTIASHIPAAMAGTTSCMEFEQRDWNAIETRCIGLGDSYCQVKMVPGEIPELDSLLEKSPQDTQRIVDKLLDHVCAYILENKPYPSRPQCGDNVQIHVAFHAMGFPHVAGERFTMAQRMGGAKIGQDLGNRLLDAGLSANKAIQRVIQFMNDFRVGKVTAGDTIRIEHNIESMRTAYWTNSDQPSCYFTTGFLNGLFSAVKNQRVWEVKCFAADDPYCEWEISDKLNPGD